jgi:hypothetical protein
MINPGSYDGVRLPGGFTITGILLIAEPIVDALGRAAVAKTQIVGREFVITVVVNLDEKEWSVTLYHEVLEAMAVASDSPPASVIDFNEGDFERAGYEAYGRFGPVSPESLSRMLLFYGFQGE